MTEQSTSRADDTEQQFTCFYLGDTLYGLRIDLVQEVNDELVMTKVPLAPDYVLGIMNLRGQIITVVDTQKKIGLSATTMTKKSRVIIIQSRSEYIGLLVDRIAEVVTCRQKEIARPPSNINGLQGKLFNGVVHTAKNELLALLDIQTVLDDETL